MVDVKDLKEGCVLRCIEHVGGGDKDDIHVGDLVIVKKKPNGWLYTYSSTGYKWGVSYSSRKNFEIVKDPVEEFQIW